MSQHLVNVDLAAPADWPASAAELERAVSSAVVATLDEAGLPGPGEWEVNVSLADNDTVRALNRQWRGKDRSTNVLSFPAADMPLPPDAIRPLGDVVLAGSVVAREAREANVALTEHLTHLVVHGMLHLLGYDHLEEEEAKRMESMERRIMTRLGLADPYSR